MGYIYNIYNPYIHVIYLTYMCMYVCIYIYIYPGGGNGNPLQYYCLANSMDRGGWQATIHRVAKSWT